MTGNQQIWELARTTLLQHSDEAQLEEGQAPERRAPGTPQSGGVGTRSSLGLALSQQERLPLHPSAQHVLWAELQTRTRQASARLCS